MENYLYNQITDAEKEAIIKYIKKYNGANTIQKPLDYILRFWAISLLFLKLSLMKRTPNICGIN